MGETTVRPTKPAAEQKDEQKGRHASTLIAVASAVTAVVAAVFSGLQVNLASSEHADTERQQLVSLTTLIATQFAQLTDSNVDTVVAELTVEGQAGTELIRELHGGGVTGTEYTQIGRALERSGYTAEAITYYKHAVDVSRHEAETHAEALRYLAAAYYSLPRPDLGHQAYMQAAKVYSGRHAVEQPEIAANSIAQAYALDAGEQLDYSCRTAQTELKVAQNTIAPADENPIVASDINVVPKEYKSKCGGKVYPAGAISDPGLSNQSGCPESNRALSASRPRPPDRSRPDHRTAMAKVQANARAGIDRRAMSRGCARCWQGRPEQRNPRLLLVPRLVPGRPAARRLACTTK